MLMREPGGCRRVAGTCWQSPPPEPPMPLVTRYRASSNAALSWVTCSTSGESQPDAVSVLVCSRTVYVTLNGLCLLLEVYIYAHNKPHAYMYM